jgi:hypothetical protein
VAQNRKVSTHYKFIGHLVLLSSNPMLLRATVCLHSDLTFSNLSFIGLGLSAVTASAISCPIVNASSFVRPGSSMNILEHRVLNKSPVSPVTRVLFIVMVLWVLCNENTIMRVLRNESTAESCDKSTFYNYGTVGTV